MGAKVEEGEASRGGSVREGDPGEGQREVKREAGAEGDRDGRNAEEGTRCCKAGGTIARGDATPQHCALLRAFPARVQTVHPA